MENPDGRLVEVAHEGCLDASRAPVVSGPAGRVFGLGETRVNAPSPVSGRPIRLKTRPTFLRAAGGRKSHGALFTLQGIARPEGESRVARVGFTVTKKVGGAVERNRIKRRLRETVRIARDLGLRPTHDYVIVARRAVLDAPFPALEAGLAAALTKLHVPKRDHRAHADTDRGAV